MVRLEGAAMTMRQPLSNNNHNINSHRLRFPVTSIVPGPSHSAGRLTMPRTVTTATRQVPGKIRPDDRQCSKVLVLSNSPSTMAAMNRPLTTNKYTAGGRSSLTAYFLLSTMLQNIYSTVECKVYDSIQRGGLLCDGGVDGHVRM